MKKEKIQSYEALPDFELAKLQKFHPDFLESSNRDKRELNEFILALALIFNDLKGLLWVIERLEKGKPKTNDISTYKGQWSGFNNQYKRLVMGVLLELLVLIDKNKSVLGHPDFKLCLGKQKKKIKDDWQTIVFNATQKNSNKKFSTPLAIALNDIRNNSSFHYYHTKYIYQGYLKWKSKAIPESQHAYVSLGPNMLTTRFFFADAASENYINEYFSSQQLTINTIIELVTQVNLALRFIVELYIKNEQKNLDNKLQE